MDQKEYLVLERDVWKVKQNSEDNLDNKVRWFTIHESWAFEWQSSQRSCPVMETNPLKHAWGIPTTHKSKTQLRASNDEKMTRGSGP